MTLQIKQPQPVAPSAHGDDLYRYPGLIKANFSSNVWPFGMLPSLRRELTGAIDGAGTYPPPHGERVTDALACHLGLSAQNICLTNGTSEAIYLIARVFEGARSHVVVPTFTEYERACALCGHSLSFVDEVDFGTMDRLAPGLWWLCNPNNPTGKVWSIDWLIGLVEQNTDCIFVVDEAYIALSPLTDSMLLQVLRLPNLLVLRSLTKSYAVPGIRVGYLAGHPQLINKVGAHQPPWSVNALAIKVVEFSMCHMPFAKPDMEAYLESSARFQLMINKTEGCEVVCSPMGYFLVKTDVPSHLLKQRLIVQHGLLVRDASSFRGLCGQYIRISAQKADDNNLLAGALAEAVPHLQKHIV